MIEPMYLLKDFDPFVYYDLKFANDKLDDQQNIIKKIRFCVSLLPNEESAALYIVYQDGSKQVKSVTGKENILALAEELEKNGTSLVRTFTRMNAAKIKWEERSVNEVYNGYREQLENVTAFYSQAHQNILKALLELIKVHNLQNLNIVEGGCGRGELLKITAHNLQNKACYFGFDFNEENIIVARSENNALLTTTSAAEHTDLTDTKSTAAHLCHFDTGNLLKTNSIIKQKKYDKILNDQWPTVLLLSGALTRLVLNDGFEALHVLQESALANVDYIIGCGVGEPLINHFIAKRVGYKEINVSVLQDEQLKFFSYQKMTMEEIVTNKRQKMDKKNLLDLSLAPNPAELLRALRKEINDSMTIDLSFCKISDSLKEELYSLVRAHKGIKLIYWHNDPEQLKNFVHSFCWCNLAIKKVSEDAYLMATRFFFRSMQKGSSFFDQANVKENSDNASITEKITQAIVLLKKIEPLRYMNSNITLDDVQNCILRYLHCKLEYNKDVLEYIKEIIDPLVYYKGNLLEFFHENTSPPKANVLNYIAELEIKRQQGKLSLQEDMFLLYTYQFGILYYEFRNEYPCNVYAIEPNRDKELEFYRYLTNKYNQQLDSEEMSVLSNWRETFDTPKVTIFNMFNYN